MIPDSRQRVINELQSLIDEAKVTIDRFGATGMDVETPEDYEQLLGILDNAVKQQKEQACLMLQE